MQTLSKWFEAQKGFGAIPLEAMTAILLIFAVAAGVTAAITAFA